MSTADELTEKAFDRFAEGDYAGAIDAFRQALEVDPRYTDALHGLAAAQKEKGDVEGAIETAKQITEIHPEDPLGFTSLSIFYMESGRIEEAEAASAKARMLDWKREIEENGDG